MLISSHPRVADLCEVLGHSASVPFGLVDDSMNGTSPGTKDKVHMERDVHPSVAAWNAADLFYQ